MRMLFFWAQCMKYIVIEVDNEMTPPTYELIGCRVTGGQRFAVSWLFKTKLRPRLDLDHLKHSTNASSLDIFCIINVYFKHYRNKQIILIILRFKHSVYFAWVKGRSHSSVSNLLFQCRSLLAHTTKPARIPQTYRSVCGSVSKNVTIASWGLRVRFPTDAFFQVHFFFYFNE